MSTATDASNDSACGTEGLELEPPAPTQQQHAAAEARAIALNCRVLLDWSEELGFTAACHEVPHVVARARTADECVIHLYRALADEFERDLSHNRRPGLRTPTHTQRPQHPQNRRPDKGTARLVRLAQPEVPQILKQHEHLIPPTPGQIRRMAESTAFHYRLVLQILDGVCYATCAEVPHVSGFGRTPSQCVAEIRTQLTALVTRLLQRNEMPPEPLQDVESCYVSRRHRRAA